MGVTSPLRIAMIAEPRNPIPPLSDSSDYPQMHHIANALVASHHTVQVCAPGPSHCDARLVVTGAATAPQEPTSDRLQEHLLLSLESTRRFRADVIHDFTAQAGPMLSGFGIDVPLINHVSGEPSADRLRNLASTSLVSGLRQILVTDNPWLLDAVPDLQWHAAVRKPVALTDCVFSSERLPYLVYDGPLDQGSRLGDLATAAARMATTLKVISPVAHAREQAYVANCLAGLPDELQAVIDFVTDPDTNAQRRLLSRALALLVPAAYTVRLQHTIGRALASGTPAIVLGQVMAIEPALIEGVTAVTVGIDDVDSDTRTLIDSLDPYDCRRVAAMEYSASRAASHWESVYRGLLAQPVAPGARASRRRQVGVT